MHYHAGLISLQWTRHFSVIQDYLSAKVQFKWLFGKQWFQPSIPFVLSLWPRKRNYGSFCTPRGRPNTCVIIIQSNKCMAVIQLLYNHSSTSPTSSFQPGQSIVVIKNKVPSFKFEPKTLRVSFGTSFLKRWGFQWQFTSGITDQFMVITLISRFNCVVRYFWQSAKELFPGLDSARLRRPKCLEWAVALQSITFHNFERKQKHPSVPRNPRNGHTMLIILGRRH